MNNALAQLSPTLQIRFRYYIVAYIMCIYIRTNGARLMPGEQRDSLQKRGNFFPTRRSYTLVTKKKMFLVRWTPSCTSTSQHVREQKTSRSLADRASSAVLNASNVLQRCRRQLDVIFHSLPTVLFSFLLHVFFLSIQQCIATTVDDQQHHGVAGKKTSHPGQ